jgi:flagellar motor protein MotB
MAAMSEAGVPLAADVSVKAVGEADGADNTESQENRRVDIIVQPHGTYNKGM